MPILIDVCFFDSLWVGEHMTTVVTHTYVHGNWINSALFVNALQLCPRERCRFEFVFLTLDDRFHVIKYFSQHEKQTKTETHCTAMSKNYFLNSHGSVFLGIHGNQQKYCQWLLRAISVIMVLVFLSSISIYDFCAWYSHHCKDIQIWKVIHPVQYANKRICLIISTLKKDFKKKHGTWLNKVSFFQLNITLLSATRTRSAVVLFSLDGRNSGLFGDRDHVLGLAGLINVW